MESRSNTVVEVIRLLRWPAVVVIVLVVGWLALRTTLHIAGDTALDAIDRVAETVEGLGAGFTSTTITDTFTAAIPKLGDEGMLLELAQLEATETFERRDERRAFYDLVDLGTTVSEIRVPVTYRYHLRLDDSWSLSVDDQGVCRVRAPRIRPTLPPAIHTDGMEKRIEGSWLRFDGHEVMDDLESTLSLRLAARAGSPARIDLIRETCRARVADFVRSWLLSEGQWGDGRIVAVEVLFADETAPGLEDTVSPRD